MLTLPDLPIWLPVAVDTETNGLYADDGARISTVSLGWIDPAIVTGDYQQLVHAVLTGEGVHTLALPFSQGVWIGRHAIKPGCQVDLFSDEASNPNLELSDWETLIEWLKQRQRHIYHNAKFDLEKLRFGPIGWDCMGYDFVNHCYWDTQVTAPEIWPLVTSSLKPTGARLWGEDETAEAEALKPYLGPKDNPRYDLVPWPVIGPYAAKDTNLTIRLAYQEWAKLGLLSPGFDAVNEKLLWACRREIAVMKTLYRMERAGIPFDADASLKAGSVLAKRQLELTNRLPCRPTSHAAKAWFFTTAGAGIQPYSHTESGNPQLTEETVRRITQDYPDTTDVGRVARVWQERSKLDTAVKMWYVPYAEGTREGRLRTCFRQVTRGRGDEDGGTRSGRFSVERVNLQAIPHDYRLVAGPELNWTVPTPRQLIGRAAAKLEGWELWEFDLAQAELRLAAAWSNCQRMLDALHSGRDLHGETASELFGVSPGDTEWGLYRQIGKRANFTLCFGAGGKTLARMVSKETGHPMTESAGARIVEDWNALYPEYRRAIDVWSAYAEQHKNVPLASEQGFASGRVRWFRDDEETHKAFNQLVQGSLGEFARDWNLLTERLCHDAGLGLTESQVGWTGLCLIIHDSQVLLLPSGPAGERIATAIIAGTRELWSRYFDTPDPMNRVSTIEGYAEGKRWS